MLAQEGILLIINKIQAPFQQILDGLSVDDFRLSPNRNKRGRAGFDSQSGSFFFPLLADLAYDPPVVFNILSYSLAMRLTN